MRLFVLSPVRTLALLAVVVVAAALVFVARAPAAGLNALTPSDTYRPTRDVAYGPLPRQRLDVYAPIARAPASGWPVIVFFYGGSWTRGERADYRFVGEALASRGVLTLVADYRLHPEVRYPAFLEDAARALAWGIEHAGSLGGDPKRLFVMGHSAGGYNAAMLALDPRWLAGTGHAPAELAGWIGLAGPYEFLPLGPDSPARPVFHHPDYPAGSQPIDYPERRSPKAFLGVPRNDSVVSPQRSTLAMAKKLRDLGVPVELKVYDGVGHALLVGAFARPLRGLAPVLADVSAWISAG